MKLTKSLPVIKERNCNASLVLDTRTNRKNVSEYPLAIRFTVDRKFFYHQVGGSYSEKRFLTSVLLLKVLRKTIRSRRCGAKKSFRNTRTC